MIFFLKAAIILICPFVILWVILHRIGQASKTAYIDIKADIHDEWCQLKEILRS